MSPAAVCDVYKPDLEAGLKAASSGAKAYADYRKLLEGKSLDAVVGATPDHGHALGLQASSAASHG